jgi:hypothetical protein
MAKRRKRTRAQLGGGQRHHHGEYEKHVIRTLSNARMASDSADRGDCPRAVRFLTEASSNMGRALAHARETDREPRGASHKAAWRRRAAGGPGGAFVTRVTEAEAVVIAKCAVK